MVRNWWRSGACLVSGALIASGANGQLQVTAPQSHFQVSAVSGHCGCPSDFSCGSVENPVGDVTRHMVCDFPGNGDYPAHHSEGTLTVRTTPSYIVLSGSAHTVTGPLSPVGIGGQSVVQSSSWAQFQTPDPILVELSYDVDSEYDGPEPWPVSAIIVSGPSILTESGPVSAVHLEFPTSISSTFGAQVLRLGPGVYDFHRNVYAIASTGYTMINVTGSQLRVLPESCSADFNNDGDVGTDADIEAFFACLAGECCFACGSSDFNADGDTGTDADIESFFRVLAGGTC
jgi:hypothetical protein